MTIERFRTLLARATDRTTSGDAGIESEFVADLFEDPDTYDSYKRELRDGKLPEAHERIADEATVSGQGSTGHVSLEFATRCYALVREREPETVVETGVCNGLSTLAILEAFDANGSGRLYSIDFPRFEGEQGSGFQDRNAGYFDGATVLDGRDPGWIVPEEYRDRWSLRLGRSQEELPELVVDLDDDVDLFVHDSEHTLPCMSFELETVFPRLSEDGLIVADDVFWNEAFSTFADLRDVQTGRMTEAASYLYER